MQEGGYVEVLYKVGESNRTKKLHLRDKDSLKIVGKAQKPNLSTDVALVGVASRSPAPAPAPAPARAAAPAPASAPEPEQSSDAAGDGVGGVRKGPLKPGTGYLFILPKSEFVPDSSVEICEDMCVPCASLTVPKCPGGYTEPSWCLPRRMCEKKLSKGNRHHCRSCGHIFCSGCSKSKFQVRSMRHAQTPSKRSIHAQG